MEDMKTYILKSDYGKKIFTASHNPGKYMSDNHTRVIITFNVFELFHENMYYIHK